MAEVIAGKTGEISDPYSFVAGDLALDLVNTEVVVRGKPSDLLTTPEQLAQWWRQAAHQHPAAVTAVQADDSSIDAPLLTIVKELRAALRRVFGAVAAQHTPAADDLRQINAVLKQGHQQLATDGDDLRLIYQTDAPDGAMLLPVALSASRLLTEADRTRLHKCRNERCVLFFYDTTKSATRQWCSLGCMDRARSAARYRQAKAV